MPPQWSKHIDKIVYNDTITKLPINAFCCMSNAQKILIFFNVWLGGSLRSGLTNDRTNDSQDKAHGMIQLKG
jgi:hypothetical protein